jgi:hypothetical protein
MSDVCPTPTSNCRGLLHNTSFDADGDGEPETVAELVEQFNTYKPVTLDMPFYYYFFTCIGKSINIKIPYFSLERRRKIY